MLSDKVVPLWRKVSLGKPAIVVWISAVALLCVVVTSFTGLLTRSRLEAKSSGSVSLRVSLFAKRVNCTLGGCP